MIANHKTMSNSSDNSSTKTPLSVVKFLELVRVANAGRLEFLSALLFQCLAICCCYLHFYSFSDNDLVTEFLATGTFCGYCIILTAVMAG